MRGKGAEMPSDNTRLVSAGGLIVRCAESTWEAALVGSGDPTVWRIPKGMQEPGESIEQTACREVQEETGLQAVPVELLGTGSWTYEYAGRDWHKTCHFFLMRLVGGDVATHDGEFDLVRWWRIADATAELHYDLERQIAAKASERVRVLGSIICA